MSGVPATPARPTPYIEYPPGVIAECPVIGCDWHSAVYEREKTARREYELHYNAEHDVPLVWVDFNDVEDGRTTTLAKYVDGVVAVGDRVLAYDFDGIYHEGTVERSDDVVIVALGTRVEQ